jgi:hypothetical protein
MFIQVNYSETRDHSGHSYSNGPSARTYTLSVANDWHENDLSIRFEFKPPKRGRNTGDNMAFVSGGEIRIPKRQAMAVAALILLYPHLPESREPGSPGVDIDEDNNANISSSVELDKLTEALARQVPRIWNTCLRGSRGKRKSRSA